MKQEDMRVVVHCPNSAIATCFYDSVYVGYKYYCGFGRVEIVEAISNDEGLITEIWLETIE